MNQNSTLEIIQGFEEKINQKENTDKYQGEYLNELYLRYMQSVKNHMSDILGHKRVDVGPKDVISLLDKNFRRKMDMKVYTSSYQDFRKIPSMLLDLDESYNTEDGQLRFLQESGFNINLGNFWTIIPEKVKERMDEWSVMSLGLEQAIRLRELLYEEVDESYNTEDGQLRFLEKVGVDINMSNFWTIIPHEIKNKMTHWKKISLTTKDAKEILSKLVFLDESYNSEYGQIQFIKDKNISVHLSQFWSILPVEVKKRMYNWKRISIKMKNIDLVYGKFDNIDGFYNTYDGLMRLMIDSGLKMHIKQFITVIPYEQRKKMCEWFVPEMSYYEGLKYFDLNG